MSTRRYKRYQQNLLENPEAQTVPSTTLQGEILGLLGYEGKDAGSEFAYDTITPTAEVRSADRAWDAYGSAGRSFRGGDFFSGFGHLGTALTDTLGAVPVVGLGMRGARSLTQPVGEGITKFFSRLQDTLQDTPQKKGTGQQFKSLLNKKGIKEEEQELTGIKSLLEQNPDRKFTSDELLDTAKLNAVEVEEVRYGEPLPDDVQVELHKQAEERAHTEAVELADEMFSDALSASNNPYDQWDDPENYEAFTDQIHEELVRGNKEMLDDNPGWERHLEAIAEERGYEFSGVVQNNATGYSTFSKKLEYGEHFQPLGVDSDNQKEIVLRIPNPEAPEVGYVVKSYKPDFPEGKVESKVFKTAEDAEEKIRMFDRREGEFNRYNNLAKLLDERIASEKRVNKKGFKSSVYQEEYSREDFDVNAVPSEDLEKMSKVYHGLAKAVKDQTFKVEPKVQTKDFNRDVSTIGHYPKITNQIVHVRTSDEYANVNLQVEGPNGTMKIPSRSKDLYIQEIQADVAQQGRKRGFYDPKELDEARLDLEDSKRGYTGLKDEHDKLQSKFYEVVNSRITDPKTGKDYNPNDDKMMHKIFGGDKSINSDGRMSEILRTNPTSSGFLNFIESWLVTNQNTKDWYPESVNMKFTPEERELGNKFYESVMNLRQAKITQDLSQDRLSSLMNKPAKLPFSSSTEKTNELALKRMLLEAVDGGYDRLAITSGEAVTDMFQGRGLRTVYDKILPKQLQKIVKKLDPSAKVEKRTSTIPFNGSTYSPRLDLNEPPIEVGNGSFNYDYSATFPDGSTEQITVRFDPVKREVHLFDWSSTSADQPTKTIGFDEYQRDHMWQFPDPDTGHYSHKNNIDELVEKGSATGLDENDFIENYLTQDRFKDEATRKEFYEASFLEITPKLKEALKKGLPLMVGAGVTAGLLKEQEKQKGTGLLK